jgi:hypothetical protein
MRTCPGRGAGDALFELLNTGESLIRDARPIRPRGARSVVSGDDVCDALKGTAQLLQRIGVVPFRLRFKSSTHMHSSMWPITYLDKFQKILRRRDCRGRTVNGEAFECVCRQAKHLPHTRDDLRPMRRPP